MHFEGNILGWLDFKKIWKSISVGEDVKKLVHCWWECTIVQPL